MILFKLLDGFLLTLFGNIAYIPVHAKWVQLYNTGSMYLFLWLRNMEYDIFLCLDFV